MSPLVIKLSVCTSHESVILIRSLLGLTKLRGRARTISTSTTSLTRFLKLKAIVFHGATPIKWIPCVNGQRPPGAVEGGYEGTKKLHVIRSHHDGGLYPGKLNCHEEMAYIANLGKVHKKTVYEVLVAPYNSVRWTPWKNTEELLGAAILGGVSESGESLLVGRVVHKKDTAVVIGKVDAKYEVCYIPFENHVYGYKEFEILVQNPSTGFDNFGDID